MSSAATKPARVKKPREEKPDFKTRVRNFRSNSPYLVLLFPAILIVFLFNYLPIYGVLIAFQDFMPGDKILSDTTIWVGFENFLRFFRDVQFWPLMKNTFLLCIIGFVIGFPLPIIVSLALNALKNRKAGKVLQTIYTAPHFISLVVLVGMLQLFFGRYGLVNNIAAGLGGERISYFLESSSFRPMYILSSNWQDFGWSAVIYIAALANVDPVQHEAAMIDGATRLQRVIHVHQAKSNETLTFNASELTFAAGGETKSLVIESNATWEIRGVEEWFTLSQTSGQGNATINITAVGNSSENERSAILTVSGATTSGHVTIMQEGRSTNLTASATSLAYEAVGGQQTLRLEGTASWTATASATWLTMDKISGQGTYDLLISCEANTQQSAREATITISYGALSKRQTITVTVSQQAAVLPVLTMPASVTIGRDQMTVSSTVTSPFAVTERGFVWSATNSTPTKSDHSISVTAATAAFEGTISGLDSGTTYYVRAYATSAVGTSYSEVLTIATSGGKPGENDNPIPNI